MRKSLKEFWDFMFELPAFEKYLLWSVIVAAFLLPLSGLVAVFTENYGFMWIAVVAVIWAYLGLHILKKIQEKNLDKLRDEFQEKWGVDIDKLDIEKLVEAVEEFNKEIEDIKEKSEDLE